jgi:hypothetical protein
MLAIVIQKEDRVLTRLKILSHGGDLQLVVHAGQGHSGQTAHRPILGKSRAGVRGNGLRVWSDVCEKDKSKSGCRMSVHVHSFRYWP